MKISSIGILGGTNGTGAVFATHFQKQFPHVEVLVSGRSTPLSNEDLAEKCDLVIFSVPIEVTRDVIRSCLPYSRPDQIWADFTSVKLFPIEEMLKSKAQVCGLHPLFGPTISVVGQKIVFTPVRINEADTQQLMALFSDLEILTTTPQEHDELMSVVQGLSHFSDFLMGVTLKDLKVDFEKVLQYSSPAYQLKLEVMGRMFSQNPHLYSQIAVQNTENKKTIAVFERAFQRLKNYLDVGAGGALIEEFVAAQQYLGADFCRSAHSFSDQILRHQHYLNQKREQAEIQNPDSFQLAIFGERGSQTDMASELFAERGSDTSVGYYKTIFEVFEAVESGRCKYGIVPFENSIMGSVFATLDELFEREGVVITKAVEKEIEHALLGVRGTRKESIKRVISHPQALAQCQKWIRSNLQSVEIGSEFSTAVAARKVFELGSESVAALASVQMADRFELDVLEENVQSSGNRTRFVLIEKKALPTRSDRTCFVFWFLSDQAGNLERVLRFFSDKRVNLTKIDSRRSDTTHGGYLFFVDGEVDIQAAQKFLPDLEKIVGGVRVFGGF